MRLTKYATIDEIIDDLVPVFTNHNGLVPMDWTPNRKAIMFSLSEDFASRLIQLNTCLSEKIIKDIYVSPSHYIKATHKFQNACRGLQYEKQLVLSTYMDLCNAAVIGWNEEVKDVQTKLREVEFLDANISMREKIAYLNALVRAYSESIYCDDHTIGGDICGPISTTDGTLIVREYRRLRPTELFNILEQFEISGVIIYCVYNTDIEVDLIGNLTRCNNMVDTLNKYYIEVFDGNNGIHIIRDESQLQKLILVFEDWLKRSIVFYRGLSESDKNRLLFQCEFYAFKPLFDYYNIAWSPQSYEVKDIKNNSTSGISLREKLASLKNPKDIIQCTREILDPRIS